MTRRRSRPVTKRKYIIKMSDYFQMISSGELVIPDYQRSNCEWSDNAFHCWVDSLHRGMADFAMHVAKYSDTELVHLIDGLQRTTNTLKYIENREKFMPTKVDKLWQEDAGLDLDSSAGFFRDLPRPRQVELLDTEISITYWECPDELTAKTIVRRFNSKGDRMNLQQIRENVFSDSYINRVVQIVAAKDEIHEKCPKVYHDIHHKRKNAKDTMMISELLFYAINGEHVATGDLGGFYSGNGNELTRTAVDAGIDILDNAYKIMFGKAYAPTCRWFSTKKGHLPIMSIIIDLVRHDLASDENVGKLAKFMVDTDTLIADSRDTGTTGNFLLDLYVSSKDGTGSKRNKEILTSCLREYFTLRTRIHFPDDN
jgi:hypothetical protein